MRTPENQSINNEPNNTIENQEPTAESRQRFGLVGHKVSDIFNSINEQRHKRQALTTATKIRRLSGSNAKRDRDTLFKIQRGKIKTDASDGRVLDALLDSYESFEDFLYNPRRTLDENFKSEKNEEKIMKNEHLRTLAISYLEKTLKNETPPPPADGSAIAQEPRRWLKMAYYNDPDDDFRQRFLENILDDEDIRNKVVEDVGIDAINECGDEVCEFFTGETKRRHNGDNCGAVLNNGRKKIELLKRLGYDYFRDKDKEDEAINLLGNDAKCFVLNQFGFIIDNDIVSKMYEIKAQKLTEYLHQINKEPKLENDRRHLEEAYSIPDWLEPTAEDETARYWREQNQKCGFDAMVLGTIIKKYKRSINVGDDGLFGPGSMGSAIEAYNKSENTLFSDHMTFFAKNLDKIEENNMKGFVSNYAKIIGSTEQETSEARSAYVNFMINGKPGQCLTHYYTEDLFDENGIPTKAFYDFEQIHRSRPKKFLPYIDKEWKTHYTDEQLKGLDFLEKAPWFDYRTSTSYLTAGDFVGALNRNPAAFNGIALFKKTNPNVNLKNVVRDDNINDYFDEDGPTPIFWQRVLALQSFDLLAKQPLEEQQKFGFSAEIQQCLKFRTTDKGQLPSFLLKPTYYINEHGEKKRKSWVENIPNYFDENGPKIIFFQKCLENAEIDLFHSLPKETFENLGLDSLSTQILKAMNREGKNLVEFPLGPSNVIMALTKFIQLNAVDWLATENELKIREAFSGNEAKDLALKCLRDEYMLYLDSDEGAEFPFGLKALAKYMHSKNGAGPLTQIESFLDFMGTLDSAGEEGKALTAKIEDRMKKYRWGNQDKANFYTVSAEVIQASPEIYHEFAKCFISIKDKKDFEVFTQDVYPLYRAKLALLKKYDYKGDGVGHGSSTANYDSVDKETLKTQLHNALLPFNLQELSPDERQKGINRVREIVLGEITDLFQANLHIRPEVVPKDFDKTDIRIIEDMTLYLSNIAHSSPEKKKMVALFLALQLDKDDGWKKLRRGDEISPSKYLYTGSEDHALEKAMQTSKINNPVNQENTGITDPERLQKFRDTLQNEVSTTHIGNIQAIDQRLQSLISGIEDLTDPDLYPDELDKEKIAILKRYSSRGVLRTADKLWRRAKGNNVSFTNEEEVIAADLNKFMENHGFDITTDNIKKHLQDGFSIVKMPFNVRQTIEKNRAIEAISELQQLLIPPDKIMHIFNKVGEDFAPQSGVVAVSADLDYLENIIVKHENELTGDEKKATESYISTIRTKMGELEKIYDKISQSFEKFEGSIHTTKLGEQLREEVAEISKTVHGVNSQAVVVTTCTNSMTTIIENMRACLSSKTKGLNNDTNLTFGEGYKFYLYSKNGVTINGSTSDEIVYFVPKEHDGGTHSMSFVMDRIYGQKNSDILVGHTKTIIKKATELKGQFPEVPISIFIPGSTTESCGVITSAKELATKLELPANTIIEDSSDKKFIIPESGFGDHFIEFGGQGQGARKPGERLVSGIEIIL